MASKIVSEIGGAISDGVRALVRQGYPLPVAKRIDSGELPMDNASRMARAEEQNFDTENPLYHSSLEDLTELDASYSMENNDMGQGLYLTDSHHDVNLNYSKNSDDMLAKSHMFNMEEGPTDGAVYELLRKKEIPNIHDLIVDDKQADEFIEAAKSQLNEADFEEYDDYLDAIDYLSQDMVMGTPQGQRIAQAAEDMGYKVQVYAGQTTWHDIRNQIGTQMQQGNQLATSEGYLRPAGSILQEIMVADGKKGVVDSTTSDRFRNAGEHTIIFPGNENQIRSPQAAFDPNYRGGNMLGNAETGLLTGVAAAGVGASTLMNQSNEPSKPSNPSKPNDYGMMERLAAATAVQQQGSITNTPMSHRDQAKQAWVEQGLRDGTISSNHSGQKMANALNIAADFVPWLGGGAGAADTYDSVAAGNYGQAVVDGGTTLAGAVPVAARASRFTKGMLGQAARAYQARKNNRSAALMEEIVNQVAGDK